MNYFSFINYAPDSHMQAQLLCVTTAELLACTRIVRNNNSGKKKLVKSFVKFLIHPL